MLFFLGIISVSLCVLIPQLRCSRTIIALNATLASIQATAMFLSDVGVGTLIYIVVCIGGIAQLLISSKAHPNVHKARLGTASFVVLGGSFLIYSSPIDLIAIIAFSISRLGEASSSAKVIQVTYLMTCFGTLTYAYLSGVGLVTLNVSVFLVSSLIALGLEYFKKPSLLETVQGALPASFKPQT